MTRSSKAEPWICSPGSPARDLAPFISGRSREFLSQLRKRSTKGQLTVAQVEASFQRFLALFPLQVPTAQVLHSSFDLMARFSLSHWDSLLLAACKEAGVTTLYSEDMQAGVNYDGVTIVNPFA